MLGFGLWWLARAEGAARRAGEGFGDALVAPDAAADDQLVRERATTAGAFDPAEAHRGRHSDGLAGHRRRDRCRSSSSWSSIS